jgi:hypothetical protein
MKQLIQRKSAASLLGLAFDGNRLEGVLVRRTNGSAEVLKSFSATLALDPLNSEPELVGRDIRNHLDAAGIRERRCVVCLPLGWALTLSTPLPDLPEPDIAGILQIEAERGFSFDTDTLLITNSRYHTAGGGRCATQVAIPRNHVARLEQALAAAQLRPVSFSLGVASLQSPGAETSGGVLALAVGENTIELQVTAAGGVVALRSLEGAFEAAGGEKEIDGDFIAREVRITLGQLPAEVRENVRQLRVFGAGPLAAQLTGELRPAASAMGLNLVQVTAYGVGELGVQLPAQTPVSAALSFAVRHLAGRPAELEFLPPKVSAWKQLANRYSSAKLVWSGATAGVALLVVAGMFLVQQYQLSSLDSKWGDMKRQVGELEDLRTQLRRFRPWFDSSLVSMAILRRLTEAFPEDGSVAAKTVEIRNLSNIACAGTARDMNALLKVQDQLKKVKEFSEVKLDTIRGKSPLQFTLNLKWGSGGKSEN